MPGVRVLNGRLDEAVMWCDVALACSGTVTLNLLRQCCPMVGVYKSSRLSAIGARFVLNTPHRLLPNIVAGEAIVPEFVPWAGGPAPIAHTLLDLLAEASQAPLQLRSPLRLHRHSGSLDLPRDASGQPVACLHPERLRCDWHPLEPGAPLFQSSDGDVIPFAGEAGQVTVFSNEAAYQEKNIATSLARQVTMPIDPSWSLALSELLQGVGS